MHRRKNRPHHGKLYMIVKFSTKVNNDIKDKGAFGALGKGLWKLFLGICMLLLVAWPFRWDKGPQQNIVGYNYTKSTVIYKTDRWTGDHWVKIYKINQKGISASFIPVAVENLNRSIPDKPWPGWHSTNYDEQLKEWEAKVDSIKKQKSILQGKYNNRRNLASFIWAASFLLSACLSAFLCRKESSLCDQADFTKTV